MDGGTIQLLVVAIAALGIGVGVALLVRGVVLRSRRRRHQSEWNAVVGLLAKQLGLSRRAGVHGYDSLEGAVGSLPVRVGVGRSGRSMKITVDVEGGQKVRLRRRAGPSQGAWSSGDPSFDQQIEVAGASPVAEHALRTDGDLRALILAVVAQWGGTVKLGSVALSTTEIMYEAAQLRPYLDSMVRLARWISEPLAPRIHTATGTAAAAWLRGLRNLPDSGRSRIPDFLTKLLEQVGPGAPHPEPGEAVFEWRGSSHDLPLRFRLCRVGEMTLEVKQAHRHGTIRLKWDPTKIQVSEAPGPWNERETACVFVARGVYIAARADTIDAEVRRFHSLPSAISAAIVDTMQRDDVGEFYIQDDGVEVRPRQALKHLLDPEGQIVRVGQLAGRVAKSLRDTSPDPAVLPAAQAAAGAAALPTMVCSYCQTLFLLSSKPFCPNCGAPAQG